MKVLSIYVRDKDNPDVWSKYDAVEVRIQMLDGAVVIPDACGISFKSLEEVKTYGAKVDPFLPEPWEVSHA